MPVEERLTGKQKALRIDPGAVARIEKVVIGGVSHGKWVVVRDNAGSILGRHISSGDAWKMALAVMQMPPVERAAWLIANDMWEG